MEVHFFVCATLSLPKVAKANSSKFYFVKQESAMIRKKAKNDPLRSASKATKGHTRSPAIPRGPPCRSHTEVGEDRWSARSSLTLPK